MKYAVRSSTGAEDSDEIRDKGWMRDGKKGHGHNDTMWEAMKLKGKWQKSVQKIK